MRYLWHSLRFVLRLLRNAVWLVGLASLLLLALLYVSDRPVPRKALTSLLDKLSPDDNCLDARDASFGLRHGLILRNVRMLPKRVADPAWLSADELRVYGALRPGRPPSEWVDTVLAHGVHLASLPTPADRHLATNAVPFTTTIAPMRVDLVDASILGLPFKRVQGLLKQENGSYIIEDLHVTWQESRWNEEASGAIRYNPATGEVEGHLAGRTVPERLYPLFSLLEANDVAEIAGRFGFKSKPIEVETRFRIAPAEPRCELRVTLSVADCTYNGVPIRRANAVITAEGARGLDRVSIEPLSCEHAEGRLSGGLNLDLIGSNITVIAQSDMPIDPLLRIIDLPFRPEQAGVSFASPPRLTISGQIPLNGASAGINLSGTLAAASATIRHIPLQDLSCTYAVVSNSYSLRGLQAKTAGGGIGGTLRLDILPGTTVQTNYQTSVRLDKLDIETLSDTFGITNRASGKASGAFDLASSTGPAHWSDLSGSGEVVIENGILSRIPLFAGLTDYFARNIPGVNLLVNQSEAHLPFQITNGVLRSSNVLIEGDVFSLGGEGTYSFPSDLLDFSIRASVFRRRTWLGQITHFVSMPFAKLLLEFRVRGSASAPSWEYRGILERIVDTVGDAVGGRKDVPP